MSENVSDVLHMVEFMSNLMGSVAVRQCRCSLASSSPPVRPVLAQPMCTFV